MHSHISEYFRPRRRSKGRQPKLPEFLCVVDAASRRSLDSIAGLVDPAQMPTVANAWRKPCRAREIGL